MCKNEIGRVECEGKKLGGVECLEMEIGRGGVWGKWNREGWSGGEMEWGGVQCVGMEQRGLQCVGME